MNRVAQLSAAQLKDKMTLEGYAHEPPQDRFSDLPNQDQRACRTSHCNNCNHEGLRYLPFTRYPNPTHKIPKTRRYRAFALCPECGHHDEF